MRAVPTYAGGKIARAQGGRVTRSSVRARLRHGSVAAGSGGAAGARRRDRAQVPRPRREQTRAPDRGGDRQAAGASAGGQGLRCGVLV